MGVYIVFKKFYGKSAEITTGRLSLNWLKNLEKLITKYKSLSEFLLAPRLTIKILESQFMQNPTEKIVHCGLQ